MKAPLVSLKSTLGAPDLDRAFQNGVLDLFVGQCRIGIDVFVVRVKGRQQRRPLEPRRPS